MKPAILVISHPNKPEIDYMVRDFGNFVSQYNIDHYLFTNYPANKKSQLEYKGAYFYNYNPKGSLGGRVWHQINGYIHVRKINNWCFSVMNLYLKGFKTLKGMGYTHVIGFIYDIEPSYPKVADFIKTCFANFKQGKKATFVQYPKALESKNGQPVFENTIDTAHFASEIDFFINVFEQGIKEYNNSLLQNEKQNFVCEHFWEYLLRPHTTVVDIIPRSKALLDTYQSDTEPYLKNKNKVLFGYNRVKDCLSVSILPHQDLYNFYSNNIKIKHNYENGVYSFNLKLGDECYISYIHNKKEVKEYLFTYNKELNSQYFFDLWENR